MKRGAFWTFESFKRDFEPVFERAIEKVWQKQEKYGKSYFSKQDNNYYLERLKQEIVEYEKHPSMTEANDIVNFALMLSMHTKESEEE